MPGRRQPALLERLCRQIRLLHHGIRAEEAYASRVRRFILLRKP